MVRSSATASATRHALCMQGITKRFGPVQALQDVNFAARPGSVHALCGENGAGKSTLMKILAGVYLPDAGTISVQEEARRFATPGAAIEAGISMIYQELDLAEDLTVAENVFLGAEPPGRLPGTVDWRAMRSQTTALATSYGFEIDADAVVANLSTGDCQVVEILKALRRNASILVMDEPTSSLSEAEARRLFTVVRQLRDKGLCIVYISHRLEEVVDLADHISVLRDGTVVHTGDVGSMAVSDIVRHMVGREIDDFFPSRDATLGEVCLQAEHLTTATGVHDVSFTVRRGEIVGLAGLVGAGRTEVAQALFGIEPLTSGMVQIHGQVFQPRSPGHAVQNGIALLTEDRKRTGLCLELACGWNITLPNLDKIGMKHLIRPAAETRLAESAADAINVKWASSAAPADSLSGGNQQKLLIARWLMAEPDLLIVDEPTRGVDVGAKREIYVLLNRMAEDGKGILFISSELPELFGVTDRILVMRRGQLVGNMKTSQTTPDEVMHLAAVE